jgi:tetratricopeptide (TPR) repeat protein
VIKGSGSCTWLNNLACVMVDMDSNHDFSLKLINEALLLKPDNPYFLDTKGWCFNKMGRNAEAVQCLEKAKKLLGPTQQPELNQHLEKAKAALVAKQ